jgi:hypothetical protein
MIAAKKEGRGIPGPATQFLLTLLERKENDLIIA